MASDRLYYTTLLKIGLPIALQNFITSSLNALGVLLVGQLGETTVAGVGLANQIFFLFNLTQFGIISGSAIFTAQFWGNRDLPGIRKVVGACMGLSLVGAALFTLVALVFPAAALGLYTNDPAVVEVGRQYLQIIGFSYLATAVSFTLGNHLRATGDVRTPMLISVVFLGLGTALNYVLIFGLFGLPEMGARGAALGTCLARLLECAVLLAVTYWGRLPTAFYLSDLRSLSRSFLRRFMATVLPVMANETAWSLGVTIYSVVYAHIGTQAIAAVNITGTIESMAEVIFLAISSASAIMIGNQIGAGDERRADQWARRPLLLGVVFGAVTGALLILLSGPIISYYKIGEGAAYDARCLLVVLGCALWLRVSNMTLIIGILRSGGDIRFSLLLDVGTVWLVGIPMALLGAFVFHLPVYWVFAMVMADDLVKAAGGLYRFLSRKWINNMVHNLKLTGVLLLFRAAKQPETTTKLPYPLQEHIPDV